MHPRDKPVAEGAANQRVDPFLGRTLADKYVVESFVGGGSMGAVYSARQLALQRIVAIKVMYPELASDRAFAARFRREAHAASRFTHPNSITIADFGEEPDGLLYLVMEYVDGPSLEDLLERREPLSEERIVDIMSQILSALAAAHDAGIVHRDLKPANVMVVQTFDDDGLPADSVKVCDFGVASLRDVAAEGVLRPSQDGLGAVSMAQAQEARKAAPRPASKALTMAGAVVGTPAYMSPEQAAGRPQDARSDLYSLGVVLFELLTRQLPFDGNTAEELMARHIAAPPPSPADRVACHPKLAEVCLRALQKHPDARFPNARAMRAELRSIYQRPPVAELPTTLNPPASAAGWSSLSESAPTSMRAELSEQVTQSRVSTLRSERTGRARWPYLVAILLLVLGTGVATFTLRAPAVAPATVSEVPREPVQSAPITPEPIASVEVPLEPPPATPASAVAPSNVPPPPPSPNTRTSKPAAATPEPSATPPATPPPVIVPVIPPPVAPPPVASLAPPPAAPAFVPDRARVRVGIASVSRIRRALVLTVAERLDVNDCYRNVLRSLGRAEGGSGTVLLDIDEDGVIVAATPRVPGPLAATGACISRKLHRQRLSAPPDTGGASAVLALTFQP